MEVNKKRNIIIIILIGLAIVLLSTGIYLIFFKTDSKVVSNEEQSSTNTIEKDEYAGKIYKTSDDRFTLKIIDKNDEKAKKDFINSEFGDEGKDNYSIEDFEFYNEIKYFAYFNDIVMFVLDIEKEDEHYITYSFGGYDDAESWEYTLIVNKDNNTIEIKPDDLTNKELDCMKSGFCGFMHRPSFIKTDLGYFFIDEKQEELYTTSWKKLGYVQLNHNQDNMYELKEIDSTGVTVYGDLKYLECVGDAYPGNCEVEYLNPIKYDINGNIIK